MSLESLDIKLEKIIWHQPSKFNPSGVPFLIGKSDDGKSIKGEMARPIVGERYRLYGYWQDSKGRYDRAFQFVEYEVLLEDNTTSGVESYLATHVPGLGKAKSAAIVQHFGDDTLAVLRTDPARAIEVPGISESLATNIRRHFERETTVDPAAYAALAQMFSGFRMPRRLLAAILKDFGSSAPDLIRENPYILLAYPRTGWKLVDAIAVGPAAFPLQASTRHAYAIEEALNQLANQGHTIASQVDIEAVAFPFLGSRAAPDAWEEAKDRSLIVERPGDLGRMFGLPKLVAAEENIAERLQQINESARPMNLVATKEKLTEEQQAAVRLLIEHGIAILAGGPGTGKTWTISRFIRSLVNQGYSQIRVAAPTGKAAKRAAELMLKAMPECPIEFSTIHRLLKPMPNAIDAAGASRDQAKDGRGRDRFTFGHNAENPIPADLIIIDESSMLDVQVASSLLTAVAPGTRLIFVGDPDQLPSVGPGAFLRDLIASGVPVAALTEVHRNAGLIAHACDAVKNGRIPVPAAKVDLKTGQNWVHIEMDDQFAMNDAIVDLHVKAEKKGNFDPRWDMQVISPQKTRLQISCDALNRALSEKLNTWQRYNENFHKKPPSEPEEDVRNPFVIGDKVVRTKNGIADGLFALEESTSRPEFVWDDQPWRIEPVDVVNGDMGTVFAVEGQVEHPYVIVRFKNPDRLCRLPLGDSHIITAYAMTCHKAQGSGFPYVIVPVHSAFYWDSRTNTGLFSRELLYTMMSRAEKLLVTIGQSSAIAAAVSRKTSERRQTRLKLLLEEAALSHA